MVSGAPGETVMRNARFGGIRARLDLRLAGSHAVGNGKVVLRYTPASR